MDELEFRKRVYTNPTDIDQSLLDAASANPALQKILDETLQLEHAVGTLVDSVSAPDSLVEKLLAIPDTAGLALPGQEASKLSSTNFFQYYALAASLLLAIGIAVISTRGGNLPLAEVSLGDEAIQHLYHEMNEIDAIKNGQELSLVASPAVTEVMAAADTHFSNADFIKSVPVKFAEPCVVLPAYHSAHLMVQGTQGAVNVIVIHNSPVSNEYSIQDDRFSGLVIPLDGGNLILIGEKNENLDTYKSMFSQNVKWVI